MYFFHNINISFLNITIIINIMITEHSYLMVNPLLLYICLPFVDVRISTAAYIFICMQTHCKLDIYMSQRWVPVSCTGQCVLWRLCCVSGAVSGLLRAERVANEWPVRGNEVRSAGRLTASCCTDSLPRLRRPLPTGLTGEICLPIISGSAALNAVKRTLCAVCVEQQLIREPGKMIHQ